VAAVCGPGIDQPTHVFIQPGHVEGAVFHADVDVVGPRLRVFAALLIRQNMPGVAPHIVDRLPSFQQLNGAIDTPCHDQPLLHQCA
jgi:hypothetical protein